MGDRKFVPQNLLDLWADLGKIELTGSTLKIPSEGVQFELKPALRFLSLLEGEDEHKLVAKVKTDRHVKEIGGEVLDDSCLIGDTAYQVQPGFLAQMQQLAAAQSESTQPAPASAAGKLKKSDSASRKEGDSSSVPGKSGASEEDPDRDAELLSKFLLKHFD